MFQADAKTTNQPKLYVVTSGRGIKGNRKGEMKMNAYTFAAYPSNNSVAAGVTFLVSAWFLVAGGLILTDSSPVPAARAQAQAQAEQATRRVEAVADPALRNVAVAPDARFTITVEASRSAHL